MVALQAVEEVGSDLPLRRYTPANPPSSERLNGITILNAPKRSDDENRLMFESIKSVLDKEPISQLRIVEEKTVMQAKAVFDLYFKRARAAIDKAAEDKFHELVAADENVQKIKSTFDKLNGDLSTSGFRPKLGVPEHQLNIYCTKGTRELVDKWSKEEADERHRLDLMQEEVEAQLLSCETYEQARAILRAYDIINNAGEMQDYQPF